VYPLEGYEIFEGPPLQRSPPASLRSPRIPNVLISQGEQLELFSATKT